MAVKQGSLLGMIQQSARNGTLLSSCEPEVRELMHQIDVLISGKQAEWAGKWAGLETQLREKERELAAVRHTLWMKDTEVGQLRQQITSTQEKSSEVTTQNDSQVFQLRTELGRMAEKYEQLKVRRRKHSNTQSVSVRKSTEEIQRLREEKQALESVRVQLERDKSVLEGQLNLAQLETTALQEKCVALEGEVKFCRSQLEQKDSLVAAVEQSSAVRAKQLEAQLRRTQELADAREASLHKVRGETEERRRETEAATAEAQSLRSQLSHSQAAVWQVKGKFSDLQLHLKKVEDQLKVAGVQLAQREQSVKLLQESSQRKDDIIKSLQAQGSELSRLQQELSHTHSQLQTHLQQEKSLRDDIATLHQRNATSKQELARLTAECASKDQRMAEELAVLSHKHSVELRELRSQLTEVALEQKETECGTHLAGSEKQLRLLEGRLRTVGSLNSRGDISHGSATTTHALTSSAHHSEHGSSPISIPTQLHTIAQSTPSHTPHAHLPTPTSTSNIIQKFLQVTDKIAHCSHDRKTTTRLSHGTHTTLHPHSHERASSLPQQHSRDFVPLKPLHSREDAAEPTQTGFGSSPAVRVAAEEGSRGDGEGRGGGEGGGLEGVGDGSGGNELEDAFSKTLDSIVDRHFQQLDSSLKKLMSKNT